MMHEEDIWKEDRELGLIVRPPVRVGKGWSAIATTIDAGPRYCERCGIRLRIHDYGTIKLKGERHRGRPVTYRVRFPRYQHPVPACPGVKKIIGARVPGRAGFTNMMTNLMEVIAWEGISEKSFRYAAEKNGVSEGTVRLIAIKTITLLEKIFPVKATARIGIDEAHLRHDGRKRAHIVDLDTGRSLFLLDGVGSEELATFLKAMPGRENVEVVVIDMWRPYRKAIKAALPHAKIVVDKWHVFKTAIKAIREAFNPWKKEIAHLSKNDKGLAGLRISKAVLTRAEHRLTEHDEYVLDQLFERYPMLQRVYLRARKFMEIVVADQTYEEKMEAFRVWRGGLQDEHRHLLKSCLFVIDQWGEEVANMTLHKHNGKHLTNGKTERVNRPLKETNTLAGGLNRKILEAKIRASTGTWSQDMVEQAIADELLKDHPFRDIERLPETKSKKKSPSRPSRKSATTGTNAYSKRKSTGESNDGEVTSRERKEQAQALAPSKGLTSPPKKPGKRVLSPQRQMANELAISRVDDGTGGFRRLKAAEMERLIRATYNVTRNQAYAAVKRALAMLDPNNPERLTHRPRPAGRVPLEDTRRIVALRLKGHRYKEIAEMTGWAEVTVKTQFYKHRDLCPAAA